MRRTLPWIVLSLFAACSADSAAATHTDILKRPLGLEKVELVANPDNPLDAHKAELGKQLFFDARLSGSGKMSCASCHHADQAFTDGIALSTRDDGQQNTRNSPTMHNVGFYDRLYWDGRAKGLEANVLAAWKSQIGGKPEEAAARIAGVDSYKQAFAAAFDGKGPSETTVVHALSSFLRSLRSGDSAFDRWDAGGRKEGLSDAAVKGHALFTGKAGCIVCHMPPLFTDRLFHNVGIGMQAAEPDVGAAKPLDDPSKTGAFKTPTLRDIAKTAPYFHDGQTKTLREAVKLMASGGHENAHRDPLMMDRGLNDEEIDQLVAFLETLTGNQSWTAPQVPK